MDWLTNPSNMAPLPFDQDFMQYLAVKKLPLDLPFKLRFRNVRRPVTVTAKQIYEYICSKPEDHKMVKAILIKIETQIPATANSRLLSFLSTYAKKMVIDKYYE